MCCTFCLNPVLLLAPLSCAGGGEGGGAVQYFNTMSFWPWRWTETHWKHLFMRVLIFGWMRWFIRGWMSQFKKITYKSNISIFYFSFSKYYVLLQGFFFFFVNNAVCSCLPCIQNNNQVNGCALWANQAHKHDCVSVHWPIFGCLYWSRRDVRQRQHRKCTEKLLD